MSIKNNIERNLENISSDELNKLMTDAFKKKNEGDDFAEGFDTALAYLSGDYDKEDFEYRLQAD